MFLMIKLRFGCLVMVVFVVLIEVMLMFVVSALRMVSSASAKFLKFFCVVFKI